MVAQTHTSGFQFNLSTNEKALASLRELLLCIRLWSTTNPIFQPGFTKTSDSFDLVAKLFDIITKQGDKAFDEGHNGEHCGAALTAKSVGR